MIPSITESDIEELQARSDLVFDDVRRQAIKEHIDTQACPGSGKTTLVSAKLILLAKKWQLGASGICVLSHTNVAKNEIVSRLEKDEYGSKLLVYPHFIGTIQEFVNRFLALPYCRSKNIEVKRIDDDACCRFIENRLSYKTRRFLEGKPKANLSNLQIRYVSQEFEKTIPGFTKPSASESYNNLVQIKNDMMKEGFYFFREMFEYSRAYIDVNPLVIPAIRSRFPIALVDEMQDTSSIQDDIINKLFSYENGGLQRFGDADQAIYSGDEEEASNSYNELKLKVINTSHRFNSSIASLASRLSANKVRLESTQTQTESQPHTIFIVDEHSRENVFSAFAKLCIKLPLDEKSPIKAVGAVGKTKKDSLTIKDYFPSFEKSHSSKNFKPLKMIEYFREAQRNSNCNYVAYKIILEGICKLLSIAGYEHIQVSELKSYLKEGGAYLDINQKLIAIQSLALNNPQSWENSIKDLLVFLDIEFNQVEIADFISYSVPNTEVDDGVVSGNVYVEKIKDRNIAIEVDTIHSVKGETHSATLLLETKFYQYDVHQMLKYIIGKETQEPKGARKLKFMKQLYVAMTRPKHLIGIAIDRSRITEDEQATAISNGWNIIDLTINV
ncbi:UvrD-helicase domain-containing protein [Alteromonas stellipolaris]|uniref:UvrD-helicase domain-containing protein n=1 Tax=Alteromonas stellipolaris TaxID=233316 RepID=UPI0026E3C57D|nr:UvrD-helicase domain-containing protein [Alteromonas stellipolaris]MDO6539564.1 UvrD-helicase domain-containing protein [Alteromonas stellipolaris]